MQANLDVSRPRLAHLRRRRLDCAVEVRSVVILCAVVRFLRAAGGELHKDAARERGGDALAAE
jgi:hypothetical protein